MQVNTEVILTHGYFLFEDANEQQIMKPYPPLGLQYIAAYLESRACKNDIFDTTFSSFEALKESLLAERPRVLGIYTNLMTRVNVLRIIRFVRTHPALEDCRIILGGPEVKHHRDNFLGQGAHAIVMGEGEQSMLELTEHFLGKNKRQLKEIAGIAFRSDSGQTIVTEPREFMADLDELPFPARDKINYRQYFQAWKERHGYCMLTINTMRGCPYACKWCSRAVYGKSYRRRSPANVIAEIAQLKAKYEFDKIWFVDDVFTINHRWLREFCKLLREQHLVISYEAISRADRMNEEVVQLLKESGCFRIWIGAESGSQPILDAMNRMVKIDKVKEMVQLTRRHGIEAGTFLMLGYPGETEQDIKATLDYLLEAKPDQYTITVAYPIKGTPFYEEVEDRFLEELPWKSSSDRDIDFKRTYNRKYYYHAMNWIRHEVGYHRGRKKEGVNLDLWLTKLRSIRARMGMYWQRQVG